MSELSELTKCTLMRYAPITDVRHPFDPDGNGIAFHLDDQWYLALEDPDDGYRSMLGSLCEIPDPNHSKCVFINQKVVCEHVLTDLEDMLVVKNAATGHVLMRIGTENTDDYYPCFVDEWNPQWLDVNQ